MFYVGICYEMITKYNYHIHHIISYITIFFLILKWEHLRSTVIANIKKISIMLEYYWP